MLLRAIDKETASIGYTDPGVLIVIKHPGYADAEDDLISLSGFDGPESEASCGSGHHFGTVIEICAILSGRYDGFLTKGKSDTYSSRLLHGFDDILTAGEYFFHVPDDAVYAVYPSFQHWRFPHDRLPSTYCHKAPRSFPTGLHGNSAYQYATNVIDRDKMCIISQQQDGKEASHLCPKHLASWFQDQSMQKYNSNIFLTDTQVVNDTSNLVALRRDLHKYLDERYFAIVWKSSSWTVHFIKPSFDLGKKYHNIQIRLNEGVSTHFLYARLAWAIFPYISPFLTSKSKRWVWLQVLDKEGRSEWQKQYLGREEIKMKAPRTPSPKEHKLQDSEGGEAEEDALECSELPEEEGTASEGSGYTCSSSSSEDCDDYDDDYEEAPRGRSKRRRMADSSMSSYHSADAVRKRRIALDFIPKPNEMVVERLPGKEVEPVSSHG